MPASSKTKDREAIAARRGLALDHCRDIPAYFVRTINVSHLGRKIVDADLDFSISENPTWRFNFVPHGPGELRAEVVDSKEIRCSPTRTCGCSIRNRSH